MRICDGFWGDLYLRDQADPFPEAFVFALQGVASPCNLLMFQADTLQHYILLRFHYYNGCYTVKIKYVVVQVRWINQPVRVADHGHLLLTAYSLLPIVLYVKK